LRDADDDHGGGFPYNSTAAPPTTTNGARIRIADPDCLWNPRRKIAADLQFVKGFGLPSIGSGIVHRIVLE